MLFSVGWQSRGNCAAVLGLLRARAQLKGNIGRGNFPQIINKPVWNRCMVKWPLAFFPTLVKIRIGGQEAGSRFLPRGKFTLQLWSSIARHFHRRDGNDAVPACHVSVRVVDIGLFLLQFGHVCLNEAFLVLEGLLQKLVPERGETLFSTEHLGLDHWTR